MPVLPLLSLLLPPLMHLAEKNFISHESSGPTGPSKREWVLTQIGQLYDLVHLEKLLPNFENIDERKFFLDICGVMIDNLAPGLI